MQTATELQLKSMASSTNPSDQACSFKPQIPVGWFIVVLHHVLLLEVPVIAKSVYDPSRFGLARSGTLSVDQLGVVDGDVTASVDDLSELGISEGAVVAVER